MNTNYLYHGLTVIEELDSQHSGGQPPGPNWPTFLKFAERYITMPVSQAQGH
jgi:hypothetical protein